MVWWCVVVCRDRHTPSTLYFFSHLSPHTSLSPPPLSLVQVQALAEDTDDDAEDVAKTYRRRQHERDRAREAAARRRDRDGFLSNSSSRGVPASPSTDSFRLSVDSRDSGLNGNGNGNASPSGSLKTLSTGSVLGTQVLGDGAPPAARRSASSGRWFSMRIRPSPPALPPLTHTITPL
jgi:hypothetical protein